MVSWQVLPEPPIEKMPKSVWMSQYIGGSLFEMGRGGLFGGGFCGTKSSASVSDPVSPPPMPLASETSAVVGFTVTVYIASVSSEAIRVVSMGAWFSTEKPMVSEYGY